MYQSYPIYDYKAGLHLAREPWLIPADAFAVMLNIRLNDGVLEKRKGRTPFVRVAHNVIDELIGASGSTHYSGTLAEYPVRPGSLEFNDKTLHITDDGDGTMSGDGSGTIDYDTGDYDITFSAPTTLNVLANYAYYPGLSITGIYSYYTAAGAEEVWLFDTKRLVQYDATNEQTDDVFEADHFTGTETDFIWTENWADCLFITNNNDRMKVYNGTTCTDLLVDIDDDAVNELDTCLMIFAYKSHLVILRTTEDGTVYPQRARWCAVNDYTDWTNDGYVDAPTTDWIMAADFLGDDLVVWFERSVWVLKYTADADLPFVWEKITDTEGSYATFSLVPFQDELITLGATAFLASDGMDVYDLTDKVPDLALDIDRTLFPNVYGAVLEEERECWWAYPAIAASRSDHMVVLNYRENSWYQYDFGMQVLGYYEEQNDPTWDDIDETWEEIEWAWDDRTRQAGYPITLGGDHTGWIYQLNDGGSDNGEDIAFELISGDWNPFWKEGRTARLGWIDFLVDRDPDISMTVSFFQGHEATAYATETLELSGNENSNKVWVRVYCGAVADFHRVKLSHTASNQTFRIHAIVPHFKAEGPII